MGWWLCISCQCLSLWIWTVWSSPKLCIFWFWFFSYFHASLVLLRSSSTELRLKLCNYCCSCVIDRDAACKYTEKHNKTLQITNNSPCNWMMSGTVVVWRLIEVNKQTCIPLCKINNLRGRGMFISWQLVFCQLTLTASIQTRKFCAKYVYPRSFFFFSF